MKKRGFTLIELLAVILILGIIALIAIPTVNNIINESKVGAWKSTANNIASSYERYYQLCQMKGDNDCVTDFSDRESDHVLTGDYVKTKLGLKGDLPIAFSVLKLNDNGDALVRFTVDGITCKNFTGEDTEPDDMTCEKTGLSGEPS